MPTDNQDHKIQGQSFRKSAKGSFLEKKNNEIAERQKSKMIS
jgi:hypothetical protein